jgi:hypothetical protein
MHTACSLSGTVRRLPGARDLDAPDAHGTTAAHVH